jgi:GNAT superfamily N-acetyltransferase
MDISVSAVTLDDIRLWRDMYQLEMSCQIVHDSIHIRRGWTQEYRLMLAETPVGYGSVAIGGPWSGNPTLYEFYVVPTHRSHVFDLFRALLAASGATTIETQSNDAMTTVMLHAFAPQVTSESILFHDTYLTSLAPAGAVLRLPTDSEAHDVPPEQRPWRRVVEVQGRVVATGGVLFHYNRPYGDIFMDVEDGFRRRGFGSFIVQELKRVCYEGGHVPAARCRTTNLASQRTLQKAGFVPCGHILKGEVARPAPTGLILS